MEVAKFAHQAGEYVSRGDSTKPLVVRGSGQVIRVDAEKARDAMQHAMEVRKEFVKTHKDSV
jgi:hypothetical protein